MAKSEITFFVKNGLAEFNKFVAHFFGVFGRDLEYEEIIDKVYQGKPLHEIYSHFEIQ